jgi:hypothetical protein
MKPLNISGQRFGKLTAMWPAGIQGKLIRWLFACDCGNYHVSSHTHVRGGLINSCGYLRKTVPLINSAFRHGHASRRFNTSEYRCWRHMVERCSNPNYAEWCYYGGRGIEVCKRWRNFENFLADMGPKPKCVNPHDFSIDRINNDGNYEPGNCRWATPYEQTLNRRTG